jgi:hypothetical protein
MSAPIWSRRPCFEQREESRSGGGGAGTTADGGSSEGSKEQRRQGHVRATWDARELPNLLAERLRAEAFGQPRTGIAQTVTVGWPGRLHEAVSHPGRRGRPVTPPVGI